MQVIGNKWRGRKRFSPSCGDKFAYMRSLKSISASSTRSQALCLTWETRGQKDLEDWCLGSFSEQETKEGELPNAFLLKAGESYRERSERAHRLPLKSPLRIPHRWFEIREWISVWVFEDEIVFTFSYTPMKCFFLLFMHDPRPHSKIISRVRAYERSIMAGSKLDFIRNRPHL